MESLRGSGRPDREEVPAWCSEQAERNSALVKIWSEATDEVGKAMEAHFPDDNPIPMIVKSGAAGNMTQVRSLAGMKGLVTNPKGEFIPRPIKSSFKEGLTVLEYFINTHGARKGLADTALRTADSGYLTRRLVDVSQDVIVREVDCGTERGIVTTIAEKQADGTLIRDAHVETQHVRPHPGRRRGRRERQRHRRAWTRPGRPGYRRAARSRHHAGQGPLGAHLHHRHRCLRHLLRPLHGHRQARRHR